MIFAMFGTNPYSFDRLAECLDHYAKESGEKIIAQVGNTQYGMPHVICHQFLPHNEMLHFIEQADIVITQGGFGSIADCLEKEKRIIAVPRKREYNECKDGGLGQEELVRELERQGKLIGLYDVGTLRDAIECVSQLRMHHTSTSRIPELVLQFVKEMVDR